jgi:hypothetical protein
MGLHRLQDRAPLRHLAGAQRGAHLPGQQLVVQVVVAHHLAVIGEGLRVEPLRGLAADHGPDPVAFFLAQLRTPFVFQLQGGVLDVGRGELDQGEADQFAPHLRGRDDLAVRNFGPGCC